MTLDLTRDTIFLALAGSQAHGTAREGSDVDLRGVAVAPLDARVSLQGTFEQHEGDLPYALWRRILPALSAHPTAPAGLAIKTESVVFDIAKFLSLCASANPNALEILFADEADTLLEEPAARLFRDQRARFLTQKAQQTYLGYGLAQLRKIRAHRSWLLSPPEEEARPTRARFGLPEATALGHDLRVRLEQTVAEKVRGYGISTIEMPRSSRIAVEARLAELVGDLLLAQRGDEPRDARDADGALRALAEATLGLPEVVVKTLDQERSYRAAVREWEAYQAWKTHRNPRRAALEAQFGYDTKHAAHLLRLLRTGVEIVKEGELRVRRRDAAELCAVLDGALTFDELVAEARRLEAEMKQAMKTTTLPEKVDAAWVDDLLMQVLSQMGSPSSPSSAATRVGLASRALAQKLTPVRLKEDNSALPPMTVTGRRTSPWDDAYHYILSASWTRFLLLASAAYLALNALFACVYLAAPGSIAHAREGSFEDAFFFSVQTMATIGYGGMMPATRLGHVFVTTEALIGILFTTLLTGLAFAKFARPTARVLFSDKAVIGPRDGVPHLMFRLANWRHNLVVEAQLRVLLLRTHTTLEVDYGHFHDVEMLNK